MARLHEFDLVAVRVKAAEDAVDAVAGVAEDALDPVFGKPLDNELAHRLRHRRPPPSRLVTWVAYPAR